MYSFPTISSHTRRNTLIALILCGASLARAEDSFREQVAPILERHCVRCHHEDKRKGKLALDTETALRKGGRRGKIVVPGDPQASRLIDFVVGSKPRMPKDADPLGQAEVDALRRWIADGAHWPEGVTLTSGVADLDWWSLQAVARPPLPELSPMETTQVRSPVDAFVIVKQRKHRLKLSPPADRRTLIRRLYADLVGLPPPPEEIAEFLSDERDDAYPKLVERLLASESYGERWARHWLDVVHYGESHGYDKDKPRPNAWPYRDYVVRAFNQDKPYARFVREQLAGDVLFPNTIDGNVATGFISAGPWDFIGHAEVPESKLDGRVARNLDRDDMVSTTMNTFVSMTVQCARCHNHKFDPVTQEDYYSLQAVFAAVDRADRQIDLDPEVRGERAKLEKKKKTLADEKKQLRKRTDELGGDELRDLKQAIRKLRAKKSDAEKAERERLEKRRDELITHVQQGEISESISANERKSQALEAALKRLPPPHVAYVGTVHHGRGNFVGTGPNGGKPREIRVLYRGDLLSPGEVVGPGTVPIMNHRAARFELPENHKEGQRRKTLADWIVDGDNPLTWRSIVNRIWQYHFGRGIVDSANDFGRMGQRPSHPELLDWLAAEFRDSEQSIKRLHRLIVNSATYRQSSSDQPEFSAIDGSNTYLWRMNRRRLDAESIRDSVLLASGKLNHAMGGPSFRSFVIDKPEHSPHYEYDKHDPNDPKSHRRSIYRFIVRSQQDPFMETLDCADPSQRVDKRNETLTALQALALLNNRFMIVMSEHFASRLKSFANDDEKRIEAAYWLTVGRAPGDEEKRALVDYGQRHGLANACRILFNLNEFVFVD